MNQPYLFVIALLALFLSCSKSNSTEQETTPMVKASVYFLDKMVGNWYSKSIYVQLNATTDSMQEIKIDVADFPEKLHISNVLANYMPNGFFTSTYIDTMGKSMPEIIGNWYALNDSLYVKYSDNNQEVNVAYHYNVNDTIGIFKTMVDWDNDGLSDDYLELTSSKIID